MLLRKAAEEDSRDIWTWRNDRVTRAMFRNSATIPWAAHERWFAAALTDENKAIFVGIEVESDLKIGMVRFDRDPTTDVAEISINLNPDMRGKGLSQPLLALAIGNFSQYLDCDLVAEVKAENSASTRIFTNVGFREITGEHGMKKFLKTHESR